LNPPPPPEQNSWVRHRLRCLYSESSKTRFFLGAFAKFRKVTIRFVMSANPSVFPPARMEQIRLPLDGFSRNFIFEHFSKICREKFRFHRSMMRMAALYIKTTRHFLLHFAHFFFRMRNVSDKSCRENQNTHFVFNNFFFENLAFTR